MKTCHPSAVRFVVTLAALAGDVPPVVRMRRALKVLRRSFGLRCIRVEEREG